MSDEQQDLARSFGAVADAYERGRPVYPLEAAAWMTGERPLRVLELGAGTGKLTRRLVELGHEVHATDPDPRMLAVLERELPDVRTTVAAAEEIPAEEASYDAVVAAQAFHWFDLERALPEIARVLVDGGRFSAVWARRDDRIPWVKRFGRLLGTVDQLRDPTATLEISPHFGWVERASHKFWQVIDRDTVQDLVLSRSHVAAADDATREKKVAEVLAFYDDYGRGMDGMQLPYAATCFRTHMVQRPVPPEPEPEIPLPEPADQAGETEADAGSTTSTGSMPAAGSLPSSDGTTELVLIDFR